MHDVLIDGSGLTPRMVLAFIKNLPLESATVAALRGGEQFRGWGPELYMITNVLDAVRENTHAFVSANSKRKPKAPEPFERPTAKAKNKKGNLFASMARAAYKRKAAVNGGT